MNRMRFMDTMQVPRVWKVTARVVASMSEREYAEWRQSSRTVRR